MGIVALMSLLADQAKAEAPRGARSALAPKSPHFKPRARRVIWLFMHGGPSHVDLFDPKPDLIKFAGKPLPESFGRVMTRRDVERNALLGPIKPFRKCGESGLPISEFFRHLPDVADELCVIRSMHGDSVNHPQSVYQMNTGNILMGSPSFGSWISYGLGTENQNMPAFIVMNQPGGVLKGGPAAWGSGYLPTTHQGTTVRPGATPVLNLRPQKSISTAQQRATLKLIRELNDDHLANRDKDDELSARVASYELAFRMQSTAPDLVDLSGETDQTLSLYGANEKHTRDFGTRCLLARRMIERGVRFVQIYSGDKTGWDAHNHVAQNHGALCRSTDKPITGLLTDLRQRGLLDDTLVIWAGEFGRMPMSEKGTGRDHNPWGYSAWVAGAGVRGGMAFGETDSVGLRAAENKVHVRDFHATLLYMLGLDHEELSFFHNGLDERLTGPEEAQIVRGILG